MPCPGWHEKGRIGCQQFRPLVGCFQGGRQHAVLECQGGLHKPGGACGTFRMADLRLYRAQCAPWTSRSGCAKQLEQRGKLHAIAGLGTRTVPFHQADIGGANTRLTPSAPDRAQLPFAAGGINSLTAAIARCAQPAQHRVNAVAIALGIRKALQNYKAYALSQNSAIGIGGERARLATLRQGGCLAETRVHKHIGKCVDAACHHNVGTARLKLHRCLVHRR